MNILLILTLVISILPFAILTLLYRLIPNQIPLFVDLAGNPTIMTAKNIISVYRLPVMGLMIQVVCILMALIKFNDGQTFKKNKNLWTAVSSIAALKMSITSMEPLIYENNHLLQVFRAIVIVTIIVAVIILLFNLFSLYRNNQSKILNEYYRSISRWQISIITFAFVVYVLMVFLPTLLS